MIGLYDHRLQRIPGGHLNDSTVEIQEDGRFHITVQRLTGSLSNTLECGRHRTGLILMRVFLPADRDTVIAPTIERIPMDRALEPFRPGSAQTQRIEGRWDESGTRT